MATRSYALEILDSSGVWQDVTAKCMGVRTSNIGLSDRRKPFADVGRFEVAMWNPDRAFNPDAAATAVNLVNVNRRIRMRYTQPSHGKILRVIHSGPYGLGAVTAITASGSTDPVGDSTDKRVAQSLILVAGQLTQITVKHAATVGAPTGDATWEVWAVHPSTNPSPGPVATGTYQPTASQTNIITVISGPAISPGLYWVVFRSTGAQTAGNFWQLQVSATSTYANGNEVTYASGTWTEQAARDVECSVTTSTINNYVGQTPSVLIAANDVLAFSFRARAQFDSIYNSIAVRIVTGADTGPFTTFNLTNKWLTYSISFTATQAAAVAGPRIIPQFVGDGFNSEVLEFDDLVLTKNGGANLLTNGDLETGAVSPWVTNNVGAPINAANTLSVIDDYIIRLNGRIYNVMPSPFAKGGEARCVLQCTDLVQDLTLYPVPVALQRNKRGDELVNAAWALLPQANLFSTLPGRLVDTGAQVFPVAFDNFNAKSSILQAGQDVCYSEGPFLSYVYCDPDGTLRWRARDFMPLAVVASPYLSLVGKDTNEAGGDPFDMKPVQARDIEISEVVLTWRPRKVIGGVVLASASSVVPIPPKQADGSAGVREVSLWFRDPATSIPCAGENVINPLVATTDFRIFENPDGTGVEYTTSPAISVKVTSVEATKINIRIENTATGPLQCTKLQCRGDAVVTYDVKEATKKHADITAQKRPPKVYNRDLPFNDSENYVGSLSNFLIDFFGMPVMECPGVLFENRADIGGVDLLGIELMQPVNILDPQSGWPSAVKHLVIGISFEIHTSASDILFTRVNYRTIRLDSRTYWILGDATYGQLGVTNRLFI